ncbi:MAG: ABC transporter substrate-binding protein [Pseudomonadota bacterium]
MSIRHRTRICASGLLAVLSMVVFATGSAGAGTAPSVREPVDVVLMSTSFGTHMYEVGVAYERVFREADSWVRIRHQETPGGMYMFRYIATNREKMIAGDIPHTLAVGALTSVGFVAQGRPPFEKCPWPTTRTLVSNPAMVMAFGTFREDIAGLADLTGKTVGTAESARPFAGVLIDRALFGKGIGNTDGINWAPLGFMGCKDALLNGTIDATTLGFVGKVNVDGDGGYIVSALAPTPPTLMLLNAGRTIHFLTVDRQWVDQGFDFSTDPIMYPARLPANSLPGLKEDIGVLVAFGLIQCDASLPDDIAAEIVRVRHVCRERFARVHASLALLPDSPYPIGSPKQYVHPAVFNAMAALGLQAP